MIIDRTNKVDVTSGVHNLETMKEIIYLGVHLNGDGNSSTEIALAKSAMNLSKLLSLVEAWTLKVADIVCLVAIIWKLMIQGKVEGRRPREAFAKPMDKPNEEV